MNFFEQQDDSLVFRENGETVLITPWGENSFRVRATILEEIQDSSVALLEPKKSEPMIQIEPMRLLLKMET